MMRTAWLVTGMLAALTAQAVCALSLAKYSVPGGNFDPPPSIEAARAEGLGDGEFFFRVHALGVQHTGNLDGGIIPYNKLNYANLAAWLDLLDRLDNSAQITPTMAAFLFGSTQNGADTGVVIDYLERRALSAPAENWRWLGQAVYLARYRLKDMDRAQVLAHELSTLPIALPYWAREMEVFVRSGRGDKAGARRLLDTIAAADPAMPENERRWIRVFAARNLETP